MSQFVGSEEAKALQKANKELRKFLDNERENIKSATDYMRKLTEKVNQNNGICDEDVNKGGVKWENYPIQGQRQIFKLNHPTLESCKHTSRSSVLIVRRTIMMSTFVFLTLHVFNAIYFIVEPE